MAALSALVLAFHSLTETDVGARSGLIDRRRFIQSVGVSFFTGLSPHAAFALSRADAVYATGVRKSDGSFALALMSENGDYIDDIALPDRIHGLAVNPVNGMAVAFARRPGTFALAFDPTQNSDPTIFHSPEERHFYGHGIFSPDGRVLYASENDFTRRRGIIGVYDATDEFRSLGVFLSYGIGPHDLAISPDGRFLVAANGGIETHPDFGRTKLNLDHMEPSIALIDTKTGGLIEKHMLAPELTQLSTRHLAVGENGRIWFACQFEGPRNALPPLAGYFALGDPLLFTSLPEDVTVGLGNYVGSITVNPRDGLVGLASPMGTGMVVTLDETTGKFLNAEPYHNAAGIAPGEHGFAVGSYDGRLLGRRHNVAFDQHIVRLTE